MGRSSFFLLPLWHGFNETCATFFPTSLVTGDFSTAALQSPMEFPRRNNVPEETQCVLGPSGHIALRNRWSSSKSINRPADDANLPLHRYYCAMMAPFRHFANAYAVRWNRSRDLRYRYFRVIESCFLRTDTE